MAQVAGAMGVYEISRGRSWARREERRVIRSAQQGLTLQTRR
jgi:hypothetical protein